MQIKYVGTIGDGVTVIEPGTGREYGTRDPVTNELLGTRPGEIIEVPDLLGASLIVQVSNWIPVPSRVSKTQTTDSASTALEGDLK